MELEVKKLRSAAYQQSYTNPYRRHTFPDGADV